MSSVQCALALLQPFSGFCRCFRSVRSSYNGTNHIISMTNLILLFQSDSQKANGLKSRSHTSKISDSRGCTRCCVVRNPFTEQRFLLAAVPRGILVMQWYQPRHVFLHEKLFECTAPANLRTFEAFVSEGEEYPSLCFGVMEGQSGNVVFNTINLNSTSNWYNDGYDNRELDILSLQQLEKDTIFVATENMEMLILEKGLMVQLIEIPATNVQSGRFVDRTGALKPSSIQAAQIFFDRKAEAMVFLQNCVLSFHRHGMQGKSLQTKQVTAEVADGSKVFRLLGSHGTIIIETSPADDPASPTNIYILVSEEPAS